MTARNPAHAGPHASSQSPRPAPWLTALLLALLTLGAAAGSLYWVRANVVLIGRDAAGYLGTTLEQFATLQQFNVHALFQAFTSDGYRTPALYIAAQPFLHWFGPTADGAQMLNVLLVAAIVPLTWLLARQVTSAWAALYAALLVALLPIVAAMGRLFYTEALLTAIVTLNLIALYRCNGFARRGWALLWGASLGVGLLVKWTMPIYIALPALWVLVGARHSLRASRLAWNWRSLLIAAATGAGFALLWYWPNRDVAQNFYLGSLLFWGWLLIAAAAIYLLLEGRGPSAHVGAALLVAAWIASLWYLPHIDFARTLLSTDVERGSTRAGLLSLYTYTRYFGYLYREHLGPLATWLIAPMVLLPWLRALALGRDGKRSLGHNSALLWLSLLSGYIALAVLAQSNARNIAPLLPALCVVAALALADYRPPLRIILGALVAGVLLVQWLGVTFDRFGPYAAARPLWVADQYAMPPASGQTNPALWVGPEILAMLSADAAAQGLDRLELGMLVNVPWLHRGNLRYLARQEGAPVQIRDLTEADASWPRLITSPWVLMKQGDNRDVEPEGRALIDRMATDPLFARLFAPARTWDLPTGERLTLYQRSGGPNFTAVPAGAVEQAAAVVEMARAGWSDHATLVYTGLDRAAWVSRADPPAGRTLLAFDADGLTVDALEPLTGTLFVVLEHDAAKAVRRLDAQAYKVAEVGGDYVWASIYGKPERALERVALRDGGSMWQAHALEELTTLTTLQAGEVIPVDARFNMPASASNLKWSLRLVDSDGSVLAASDRPIVPADRFGLLVPPQTPPGAYALVAVAYDPATLAPVPTDDGRAQVDLTEITVRR